MSAAFPADDDYRGCLPEFASDLPWLSPAELREGAELLHEASDVLGHIPAEVCDLLSELLHSDSTAAGRVLRWLRGVAQ